MHINEEILRLWDNQNKKPTNPTFFVSSSFDLALYHTSPRDPSFLLFPLSSLCFSSHYLQTHDAEDWGVWKMTYGGQQEVALGREEDAMNARDAA